LRELLMKGKVSTGRRSRRYGLLAAKELKLSCLK
jgi:hypothetical protein